jgi:RecB family exonuclease
MTASRKLFLGPFHPALETALAGELAGARAAAGPLAPLRVVVPTRLLGLHLRRKLAGAGPGHVNLRFVTLADLALQLAGAAAGAPPRCASPLALELLCRRIIRDAMPAGGHFAPVRDTQGFAPALRATFTDLKEACVSPHGFRQRANSPKLRELADAYAAFCDWLDQHQWLTEADLCAGAEPTHDDGPCFLYGFYDLNTAQKQLVLRLNPAAVFFPWTNHSAGYAQPLRDWFVSRGYRAEPLPVAEPAAEPLVLSCPGETAEVREAVREILRFAGAAGRGFNDAAVLSRSREPYDAIARDVLPQLGIRAFFRGGRPLAEHPDAQLLQLLLEAVRSRFSRAGVMELLCHCGPHASFDALSVQLGIVGGRQQWLERVGAAARESAAQDEDAARRRWQKRLAGRLLPLLGQLFEHLGSLPDRARWSEFSERALAAFDAFGGRHPAVCETVRALAELDAIESPVGLDVFTEFCGHALEAAREQPEKFQDGALFVSDVMGARGLDFPLVVLLGMVERSFPRIVREDPLLLDDERAWISDELPLKRRGHDEERLLFDLARDVAREKLLLSYPRLQAGSARPRVPSFLLLEATGTANGEALESLAGFRKAPLSALSDAAPAIDEREFDLAALHAVADPDPYLAAVAPRLRAGVAAERQRWRQRALTAHDGLIEGETALQLLRERFGLENLTISATALEEFFKCPFYYLLRRVLRIEPWEEPEAEAVINPLELGALYHAILEQYYRRHPDGDLDAIAVEQFERCEREGVTGYPAAWQIKKEIVRHELAAFIAREREYFDAGWRPHACERRFGREDNILVGPVRLQGKIDRLDLSADGRRARVVDYKTGRAPDNLRDDSLAAGRALQLPLYLLAAGRLLGEVAVQQADYVYFTLRGGHRTIRFSRDALQQRGAELDRLLQTAAEMIRQGCFAQYATQSNCRRCDFRPVCGNGILRLYERKADDRRMAGFREIKESIQ